MTACPEPLRSGTRPASATGTVSGTLSGNSIVLHAVTPAVTGYRRLGEVPGRASGGHGSKQALRDAKAQPEQRRTALLQVNRVRSSVHGYVVDLNTVATRGH
jgi:hypothetical protein